jgi:hypothetical protein
MGDLKGPQLTTKPARTASREARRKAGERLGDLLPNGRPNVQVADNSSPCTGWHVAAEFCYRAATQAPDIDTAIEWYLLGDACDTAAEGCEALSSTLP